MTTPEKSRMLPEMQHQRMLGQRLLMITAHPDDEAFLAAGTTNENYKLGGVTGLICATLGEKGSSHLIKPVTKTQLKKIRKRELGRAARLNHMRPVHVLNLPDGGVINHAERFYQRALPFARQFRPDIIVTFGPDGITGHRDHITAGKVARRIAKTLNTRLCVFTVAPTLAKSAPAMFKKRRANPFYQRIARYQPAIHRITIAPRHKIRVLQQYVSQIDGRQPYRSWPPKAARIFKTFEYFGEMNP